MTKIRLLFSLLGLAALVALVWFAGPLLSFGGSAPLDSELRRLLLVAALVALWACAVAWRVVALRRAERRLAEGLTAAPAAPAPTADDDAMTRALEEAELLRDRFRAAMALLRKAGRRGGRRLSELPWYILIGPPGAGKTTALQNSGLHFPLADHHHGAQPLHGVGGTRHCDWWFTDEAVLIDTAGRYTTQDSDATVDSSAWTAFLALLRRHRRPHPINGIVVAISLEDVLTLDAAQREQQGRAIQQRIAELNTTLGLRFPVYVMLTKADRVAGFTEFFGHLSRTARDQVWGMTFAAEEADALGRFAPEYDALVGRLNEEMLTRLDQERDPARRTLLFGFPREAAMLRDDLGHFLASVFRGSRFEQPPWLRGVYLTSATQAGTPIDRALEAVTRSIGLRTLPPVATAAAGSGRSYFLADLLQRVIIPEAGLVGFDRRAERRRAWRHGLACGAAALGVAAGVSVWAAAYARGQAAVTQLLQRLEAYEAAFPAAGTPLDRAEPPATEAAAWNAMLPRLDALRDLAATADAAAPGDRGLRQTRALDATARRAYLRELNRLLAPRLAAALARSLRAAQGQTDPTYAALKGYLMLGQPQHLDAAYLRALLQSLWDRDLPRQATSVARLQGHLAALLAGGLAPQPLEAEQVRDARAVLDRVPLAELAYSRIKREALAHDELHYWLVDAVGAAGAARFERRSGLPADPGLPGLYTARGYAAVFVPQSLRLAQSLRSETWVIASEAGAPRAAEVASLADDVGDLYAADYIQAWKGWLADLRIAGPRTPAQGLDALAALSGRNSALRALLLAADRQTRLVPAGAEDGSAGGGGLLRARQELAQWLKADAARKAGPVDQRPPARIAAAFADLGALVQADKDGRAPLDAVIERLAALYAELAALQDQPLADPARRPDGAAARSVIQIALAQPQPLKDWLLQIAGGSVQLGEQQQAAALQKKRADDAKALREKINAAWQSEVLPFCTAAVSHRYPVDKRSASDITLQDFSRLFGPRGLIDSFVQTHLRPFIDAGSKPWRWRSADDIDLGAAPQALRPLQIAAAAREAFFRDAAAAPGIDFALRPLPGGPEGPQVTLAQGGQQWPDRAAPAQFKAMHWPAADGGQPLSLTVADARGGTPQTRGAEGPWALFRLLDQATLERLAADRIVATFGAPARAAQIELHASSVVNPFQPLALDQFQCPQGF
jgi:type VI secretion system protein ImpL